MKIKGLWKRGNNYWFRIMREGKQNVYNLHTGDINEAIRLAHEYTIQIKSQSTDLLSIELEKIIQAKLKTKAYRKKTAVNARSAIQKMIHIIGDESISRLNQKDGEKVIKELRAQGLSEFSLQAYVRTYRSLFNDLKAAQKITFNPFEIKLPKLPKSPRRDFLTTEKVASLIANAPDDDMRFILYCGFDCGMRKLEIIEARPEWFDLHARVVHISRTETYTPKDSDDRTVPLSSRFITFLRAYGLRSPFMLKPEITHAKSEYRYDFRTTFETYAQDQFTAHTMRRTFASLLAISGVSIYKIAKWLGDDVETVQKAYAHLIAYDSDIDRLHK